MRGIIVAFLVLLGIGIGMFFPAVRGEIPFPGNFLVSWYEPWKTLNTVNGVPAIAHKPVVDDAFRHLYPLRVIAATIMRHGQLPLWNPYNASGTPLLAIMHPGYLTPFGSFFSFP